MRPQTVARAVGCVLAVWIAMGGAWAQTTGTIRGTVKDPSGAVIPGAKVTVAAESGGITRSVSANESGGELSNRPLGPNVTGLGMIDPG